ncbi:MULTISPECIES: SDR family oxidoreductase [unclassified Curtobacterium]|jgi:NAD(P)-dependent dehydrogenase (short-subunit alcohol dehydrogenase family)|uniref:SDR family oxidoreductase n=1 Tax=unclassified Curtobacterium TaxID=257496 RepID=UPI0008DD3D17|nr:MULTISPECIES: SDR family oxidoreductase [unclassified Curtobacterium]MCC8909477.1 SDR family oxidoreductase [Curtobacterium sp. GD1]OII23162.1 short-chain dehydrogenase [Curtobacterium sp. MCBA15_013]
MTTLTDATVLVTGANGGLGAAFVQQALDRGAAKVYATARTPRTWDDERIVPLALDVTDQASVDAAARAAADATVVVNNAGIGGSAPLLETSVDEVEHVFATNVFGALRVAKAFAPSLAGGALIDVHSVLSWIALAGGYSASKAAFWSITNSLRLELAPQGTQVLGAHLGYTDTGMTADLDVEKADPADIVAAIYDALEAGEHEVLADQVSRDVRAGLSAPLTALYPALASA